MNKQKKNKTLYIKIKPELHEKLLKAAQKGSRSLVMHITMILEKSVVN